ncbi:MAG: hypothetical protein EA380_01490 [Phycisphaeraceae bacterium]|nr:MAG: hypothetical protein EA380_01490 [Phycisphaeraceae bacterium]
MSKMLSFGAALSCALGAAGLAQAGVIMHTDLPNGQMSVNLVIDGVNIQVDADPRAFKSKTVAGTTGVGIAGGSVDGEIDNSEYILFTFSTPVVITSLQVVHLYAAGNYGDTVSESARITADGVDYVLQVVDGTTATWTGLGSVSNHSPGLQNNGGHWEVFGSDIFGSAITTLKLRSNEVGGSPMADYGFYSLAFVPTPGAMALAGVSGLCLLRRRRG